MRRLRDLLFRLRALVGARRMERELDEEMRFHLDMAAEKLEREGMPPEEARRAARRRFGTPRRQRDRARWTWGLTGIADIAADLRLVGRQLRRSPGFAAGAIVTLALGIGAVTAIFSVAERALLRSPAVAEGHRLAAVYTSCRRGGDACASSYPDYADVRDRSRSFGDVAAYTSVPLNVGGIGTAGLATGLLVTGNYFSVLGVTPREGRAVQPADDRPGDGAPVAVLSHRFWTEAFGADPTVVGETIRLNGAAFEVIGVAPAGFEGLDLDLGADIWIPLFSAPLLGPAVGAAAEPEVATERGTRWIGTLVGRLAPDATFGLASAELDALASRLAAGYPEAWAAADGVRGFTVDPLEGFILPHGSEATLRRFVFLLLAVVGIALLLASANLANLLLARATARRAEIAVRMATGASRGRIVRQLLTESLSLALLGGAAGLGVAKVMLGAIASFELPGSVSVGGLEAGLDPGVLGFALALSTGTALLFGLIPALQTSRVDLVRAIKGEAGRAPASLLLRKGLVAAQVGLCVILLVGSALFLRTLRNSLDAELGFEPEGAVAARFNLALLGYSEERGRAFVDELLEETRAIPGVEAAGVATLVPFQNGGFRGTFAEIDGYEPAPDEEIRVDWVPLTPGTFEALGIRLLEGRDVSGTSGAGRPTGVVINRHMAERYWPGADALGGTLRFFGTTVRVIGIVEDPVWSQVGEEATPFVFFSLEEVPMASTSFLTLAARTSGDPESLLPALRERFRAIEPGLSVSYLRTMEEQVGAALMPQRMGSTLFTMFGVLALVLAAVGVYGVVSYTVRRRSRDIGIRMALGASRRDIFRSVTGDMTIPIFLGLAGGALVASMLAWSVEAFMYGVRPRDPWTFAIVLPLLAAVAFGATLIPARSAARLDPVRVLKTE